jgi:hypothetical protein
MVNPLDRPDIPAAAALILQVWASLHLRQPRITGGTENNSEATIPRPPPLPRPTNYYSFTRNGIIGDYVIDPTLQIPAALLSPLGRGQTEADRKNLILNAERINIDAVIWLVGNEPEQRIDRPVSLVVKAAQGPVTLKVVRNTFHIVDNLTVAVSLTSF